MDIDMKKIIMILIGLLEEQEGIDIDYSFTSKIESEIKAG